MRSEKLRRSRSLYKLPDHFDWLEKFSLNSIASERSLSNRLREKEKPDLILLFLSALELL